MLKSDVLLRGDFCCYFFDIEAGKKSSSGGKPRDESMIDKKHELEKRLENVKGALGAPAKKPPKKGLKFTATAAVQASC